MTTARADLLNLGSAIDDDGDTAPFVAAYGTGVTAAGIVAEGELVAAHPTLDRRYRIHAIGGQLWLSFGAAANASVEPRGLLQDGDSVQIVLKATHTARVAPASLS